MTRLLKTALALSLVAAALSITTAAAAAEKPCWEQLINDWYDGRIDKTYPVKCYQDALKNVPEEGESYTSLPEDLRRALALAIRPKSSGRGGTAATSGSGQGQPGANELDPTALVPAGAPGRE